VIVARTLATEGLRLAESHEDRIHVLANGSALGFLELSLGNPAGAHEHLGPLVQLAERMGLEEPGIFPFLPDEIESLISLGDLDGAETLLERFEDQATARDRALALAGAARSRGLLSAARGELDGAITSVEEALDHLRGVPQPFERARTLLVKGQIQRRQKRKRPARETLDEALELFVDLGGPLWAEKARSEIDRIGGRPPPPTGLTPTEMQIADLVGQGMTNREVAAALFISEHTVRGNLKRIYGKLDVRSRTELAALLAGSRSGDG
jgi:DNA-binding CsgD family transcriptional regulator